MRKLFQFFAAFDWISPTIGFLEDVWNDPTIMGKNTWTFFFSYSELIDRGWDPYSLRRILGGYGIKCWGSQLTRDRYFFNVDIKQASWAEYILGANNIPIDPKSVGAPRYSPKHSPQSHPAQKQNKSSDPLDFLDSMFDELFG
jgi:hypothetical protein